MRVGLIGTGRIGGTLARLLVAAGDQVLLSATDPNGPERLAADLGDHAIATDPAGAIAEAEVIIIAVWWPAFEQIGRDYGDALRGKIVIDPSNPIVERDGQLLTLPIPNGLTSPQYQLTRLGDVRLVRTFGDRFAADLLADGQAGQAGGQRTTMRYWSDDPDAAAQVVPLIDDAGFHPVAAGDLTQSKNAGE
ncbi:NADPH-dependent F420 reductase [Nocardia sp. NPDC055321]